MYSIVEIDVVCVYEDYLSMTLSLHRGGPDRGGWISNGFSFDEWMNWESATRVRDARVGRRGDVELGYSVSSRPEAF